MSTPNFRWSGLTIDCTDLQLLAQFWSALLTREISVPLPGWLRLGALGGRSLDQRHEYDEGTVVVMADPEGNEFCLVHYFAA